MFSNLGLMGLVVGIALDWAYSNLKITFKHVFR